MASSLLRELIARTLDAAWEEVAVVNNDANSAALRALMAAKIMAAVHDGERNSDVLKRIAVEAFAKS